MSSILKWFKAFFNSMFAVEFKDYYEINVIPMFGDKGEQVRILQKALNRKHSKPTLKSDGDFGKNTLQSVKYFQRLHGLAGTGVIGKKTLGFLGLTLKPRKKSRGIPWYWKLKEFDGSIESDTSFGKKMSTYWKYVGLPGFKSIIGSKRAWCGLFIAAGLIMAGHDYQKDGAGAKNWDKFGVAIDWKKNGFPQGALVRTNSRGDCSSGSGNHVTLANGNCSAKDLLKPGATFSGYGGNQGNKAKVSTYSVSKICSVRWPKDAEFPGKVTKSLNCSNGKTNQNESTR